MNPAYTNSPISWTFLLAWDLSEVNLSVPKWPTADTELSLKKSHELTDKKVQGGVSEDAKDVEI